MHPASPPGIVICLSARLRPVRGSEISIGTLLPFMEHGQQPEAEQAPVFELSSLWILDG